MELYFLLLSTGLFLSVQPTEIDRNTYCESCLAVSRVIATAIKEAPSEKRLKIVDKLLTGGLCTRVTSLNNDLEANNKLKSACIHLMDSQAKKFRAVLLSGETTNLDVVLCYEQSAACVGVKHQSFEDSKAPFKEIALDDLIKKNKDNLRMTRPVQSDTTKHLRDEL